MLDAIARKISTRGGAILILFALAGAIWTGATITVAKAVKYVNDQDPRTAKMAAQLDTLTLAIRHLDQRINEGASRDSAFAVALQHPLWSRARQRSLGGIINNDHGERRR